MKYLHYFHILNIYKNKRDFKIIVLLENVTFKELKLLDLSSNNISNVNFLEKVKIEKLEILNLRCNEISD